MDIFTKLLWVVTVSAFIISIYKDRDKTLVSMKMAQGMMKNMIGEILGIMFLIGVILTFIPPETIREIAGKSSILISTFVSALLGSITLIPAFVAFPLVGSLVDAGINIMPAVAFLTTLTMVGIVTFSLEKEEFGTRFAIARNSMSFVFAIVISLLMGVVM